MRRDDDAGRAALPEIVRRAAAILARQAPMGTARPVFDRNAAPAAGCGTGLPGAQVSIAELQQRAQQLMTDFFASLGSMSDLHNAIMMALSTMPPSVRPTAESASAARPSPRSPPPSLPAAIAALPAAAQAASGLSTLLWLAAPAPTSAGQSVTVPLDAENRSDKPIPAAFYSTDLLSENGRSIPAYQVSFQPPNAMIRPGERSAVRAKVEIPLQSIPGTYSGLVQAVGLPDTKAVITIQVA